MQTWVQMLKIKLAVCAKIRQTNYIQFSQFTLYASVLNFSVKKLMIKNDFLIDNSIIININGHPLCKL